MADWKSIIRSVAPSLATALGGPLAGAATAAIGNALLGNPGATTKDIDNALAGSLSPDILLKLKEADQNFETQMATLGVKLEELDQADRDSARARETSIRDWVPGTLAVTLNAAFFGLLALVLWHPVPESSKSAFDILLGMLGTGTASVWGYYFGSSAGSRAKDAILNKLT